MKKIEKNESSVKNLAAFVAQNMDAMRAAYQADVAALLVELMPRIARGDFTNMGDDYTYAPMGAPLPTGWQPPDHMWIGPDGRREIPPGSLLLERAIEQMPICTGDTSARMVLQCSKYANRAAHEWIESCTIHPDDGKSWATMAAWCLVRDVRDAFRQQRKAYRKAA